MTGERWRPIAACPPDLRRAVVFDPDNASLIRARAGGIEGVADERIVVAERDAYGRWRVDSYRGGYDVEPTHFLDPSVPEGFPAAPDPGALQARDEAHAAARREAFARSAAVHADRERALNAAREAYWADPANWLCPPQDP